MKKIVKLILVFTVSLGALFAGIVGTGALNAATKSEINFIHINIDEVQDKSLIQTGTPTEKYVFDTHNIYLVYQKTAQTTLQKNEDSTSGNTVKPSKPTVSQNVTTTPTVNTGNNTKVKASVETNQANVEMYVIAVIGLGVLFGYLIITKKYKALFVFVLITVGGFVVVDATQYTKISKDVVARIEKDTALAYNPQHIEGYEYVGYISDKVVITVNYTDEAGKVITTQEYVGQRGTNYTIPAKEIDGYTPNKLSIPSTGVYEKNTTVTYVYKEKVDFTYNIKFVVDNYLKNNDGADYAGTHENFVSGGYRKFYYTLNEGAYPINEYRYYLLTIDHNDDVIAYKEVQIGDILFFDKLGIKAKKEETYQLPKEFKLISLRKSNNNGEYSPQLGNIDGEFSFLSLKMVLESNISSTGKITKDIDFIYQFEYNAVK